MNTRTPANLPTALFTARRQLDLWRSRQSKRARLPEGLWHKAVVLARKHGLNKTASALGLKYDSLKKHIKMTGSDEPRSEPAHGEFLELLPSPMTAPSITCKIELEDGHGTTMRMYVKGATMAELASFAGVFRSGRT
jgi:hypothetical protein